MFSNERPNTDQLAIDRWKLLYIADDNLEEKQVIKNENSTCTTQKKKKRILTNMFAVDKDCFLVPYTDFTYFWNHDFPSPHDLTHNQNILSLCWIINVLNFFFVMVLLNIRGDQKIPKVRFKISTLVFPST